MTTEKTDSTEVTHVVKQGDTFLMILMAIFAINPTEAVPYQDIVTKALELMNLPIGCMGYKDGRPCVFTPFSNGGMTLRQRGFIVGEGRAWRLTDAGRAVVASGVYPKKVRGEPPVEGPTKTPKAPKAAKTAAPVTEETNTAEEVETVAEQETIEEEVAVTPIQPLGTPVLDDNDPVFASVEATPQPKVEATPAPAAVKVEETPPAPVASETPSAPKAAKKLSVIAETLPNAPEWTKDGYLRALVAANTPCYGAYSPKVKTCEACPLVEHCQRAQATALSVLAGVLKDKADKASKLTATEVSSTHGAVAAALTHSRLRTNAGETAAKLMTASFDGVCARSGETISKGDKVYYVPGEGLVSEKAFEES